MKRLCKRNAASRACLGKTLAFIPEIKWLCKREGQRFSYRSLLVEVLVKRRREALLADGHVADRHVAEKIQLDGLAPQARNDQPQRFYHDRPQTGRPLLTNRQGRRSQGRQAGQAGGQAERAFACAAAAAAAAAAQRGVCAHGTGSTDWRGKVPEIKLQRRLARQSSGNKMDTTHHLAEDVVVVAPGRIRHVCPRAKKFQ